MYQQIFNYYFICYYSLLREGGKTALVLKVDYINSVTSLKSKIHCMVFLRLWFTFF